MTASNNTGAHLRLLFLVLQVSSGHIGIFLLLITLAFSSLKRLPTLYGLLVTWFATSVICTLLYYADGNNNPHPAYPLCLTQASFISAVPLMTSLSAFCLMYEGWMTVQRKNAFLKSKLRTTMLLAIPWTAFIVASFVAFTYGYADPTKVRRKHLFYCTLKSSVVLYTFGTLTGIVLTVTVIYGAKIALQLYHRWSEFKASASSPDRDQAKHMITSPYVALRIALFGFAVFLSLTLMVIYEVGHKSQFQDVLCASIPTFVVAIFGTQADVIRVWISLLPIRIVPRPIQLWVKRSAPLPSTPSSSLSLPTTTTDLDKDTTLNSFDVWKEKYLDLNLEVPASAYLKPQVEEEWEEHVHGRDGARRREADEVRRADEYEYGLEGSRETSWGSTYTYYQGYP